MSEGDVPAQPVWTFFPQAVTGKREWRRVGDEIVDDAGEVVGVVTDGWVTFNHRAVIRNPDA